MACDGEAGLVGGNGPDAGDLVEHADAKTEISTALALPLLLRTEFVVVDRHVQAQSCNLFARSRPSAAQVSRCERSPFVRTR